MNRRLAISIGMLMLAGCRNRVQSYDDTPDRFLPTDNWLGWYFHRVSAKFVLPLNNPAHTLSRPDRPPTIVQGQSPDSSGKNGMTILSNVANVRPVSAEVELEYDVNEDKLQQKHEMVVTLHWPNRNRRADESNTTFTESRTVPVDYHDIRYFLEGSSVFRVEYNEHYYGIKDTPIDTRSTQFATNLEIEVDLEILGPNPSSDWRKPVMYRDVRPLFTLAERAWPGLS